MLTTDTETTIYTIPHSLIYMVSEMYSGEANQLTLANEGSEHAH